MGVAALASKRANSSRLPFDYFAVRDFTLSRYGQLTGEALQRFVIDAVGASDQALDIAFGVVAADLSTGTMIVFTRGNTGAGSTRFGRHTGDICPAAHRNRVVFRW